jgi:hypothetical protein
LIVQNTCDLTDFKSVTLRASGSSGFQWSDEGLESINKS